MPTQRIFSRDIDLKGYTLKNLIFNPMNTAGRVGLTLGTSDEGYAVWDTDLNAPYYWDGTAWVTITGEGGSFPKITYAELQALNGGSVTTPYYMTDSGREGWWYYTGTVADQSSDNGGTIIVAADLKQYRRSYSGGIQASWFGLVGNSSGAATANVTAINAALTAARNKELVHIKSAVTSGPIYLDSTITIDSTFEKRYNVFVEGDVVYTGTGDCFVLEGGFSQQFKMHGRLIGPNSGGNGSAESTWTGYTGRGVYMKNLFNSDIEVDEIEGFRVGLEMSGDNNSNSTSDFSGSQYNRVRFRWLHHNYIQIKISTYGTAGTHGNYSNESYWYGGQLGRGIPGVTYGGGGWYGMVVNKDSTASGVTNPQPWYGISGHNFYDVGFEGLDTCIVADYSGSFNFIGCSFEPEGAHTHFSLHPTECRLWRFSNGTAMRDSKFAAGRKGYRTFINDTAFYTSIASGTNSQFAAHTASSIPAIPAMTGFTHLADGQWIISQDSYPGPSVVNNNDDQTHIIWSKLAQFPTVQNGLIKIEGAVRNGAYKQTYRNVSSSTTDSVVDLPANCGYIRYAPSEPKTLRINAGDIRGTSFEYFILEKLNDHAVTFTNAADNTVLIASSNFPSIGKYYCVYRSGVYVVWRIDGGGGTTANLSLQPVGTTPNATAASYNSSTGAFNLEPASANFPGVWTIGAQQLAGNKELVGDFTLRRSATTTLTIDNTSGTETTLSSINVTNVVGGTFLKVNNNSILQLGRKDNTAAATLDFANGKTFASGVQWSIGLKAGDNIFRIYNGSATSLVTSIHANGNFVIGNPTSDPGFKLYVAGTIKATGSIYLGSASADPSGAINGQLYYNSSTNKLRGYENGAWQDLVNAPGSGGDGITSFGPVGSGNANGGSVSGSVGTLHLATSTQPGLWGTGTQTLPGNKTFTGTLTLRAGSLSAGTAPLKIPPASALMLQEEPNAIEHFAGDLYFTNNAQRCKILTSCNNATLTGKTWQGEPIDPVYGGRDIDWEDGTPTYAFGSGTIQGTHSFFHTCPSTNTNARGVINLNVGVGPTSNGELFRVTFSSASNSEGTIVVFSPANQAACTAGDRVWMNSSGTTSFSVRVGTAGALTANTQYIWNYHVMQLPD